MFFLQKILNSFLTLLGVVSLVFLLFSVVPGDPAKMMLDQNEDPQQLAIIRHQFGFDLPVWQQYLYYLNDLSPISWHSKDIDDFNHFSKQKYSSLTLYQSTTSIWILKFPYLRESFQKKGMKVNSIIADTLPNTIILAIAAIGIALVLGVILGVISAIYTDTWIDRMLLLCSTLGMSTPSFLSAILFSWMFGFVLHDITGLDMTGSLYAIDDLGQHIYIRWQNLILPAIVLGIRPLSVVSQLMRNSLLETLNKDFIRTAKSKGINSFQIIKNHALRNSLNPVITAISGWFASLLAGAVFVEYIFGWNGLGKEIVTALDTKDLPVIMGSVIMISIFFIMINILVDIIYRILDPRVRI